jgi:hypothetical protein
MIMTPSNLMESLNNPYRCPPNAISPAAGRGRWRRQKQLIAASLAAALLLLRVSRALGDENDAGYRKSYYLEDDDRIRVSTDLWQFDVGVNDHVRVDGNVVVDAIS